MSSVETADRTRVYPVIGLEVHAQLLTRSKLFCPCPSGVGAEANRNTCPTCLGFPGTLPVLNREAVTLAMRLAIAAGAQIHRDSRFSRKNYFYPDLPKGYQITQYDRPIATGGGIEIDTPAGPRTIRLTRIHLEEDAGKSLHDTPFSDVPETVTLVDWNRAGVPLCEIVSEPEIRTAEEAASYLTELRRLLRFAGVSDADMEKGNLRCDANVSVRASETGAYGTRVEIKNLNSIRFVAKAIEHEIERQEETLRRGEPVVLETRLWDERAGRTISMRGKEEAQDYRYFPEPDLGALRIDDAWLAEAASGLPELPRARRSRFIESYGLSLAEAELLTSAKGLADYYEKVLAHPVPPALAAKWTLGEVLRWMNDRKISREDALSFRLSPSELGALLLQLHAGEITVNQAKERVKQLALPQTYEASTTFTGHAQLSADAIVDHAREVVRNSPSQVALYRSGKIQTFSWFVGQVMKRTGGRADPARVREALTLALGETEN